MDLLEKCLTKIRVPTGGDLIFKDECLFSFDTPESPSGLYVCLNTFLGFGEPYVELYSNVTGHHIFLHLRQIKKEIPRQQDESPERKVKRLALGVPDGFDPDAGKKYEFEERNGIVIMPGYTRIPLPNPELPGKVQDAVAMILAADSAQKLSQLQAMAGTWDGEVRQVSKHAEALRQLNNGVKIPPKGWKCSMCEKTDNLWLNLTDGTILCGRKYANGSGGNNHAVDHYKNTGFPLVVKLGTITPDGKADVYSYDEDDMVEDPRLPEHLAHFGINFSSMEKTEKTMNELEIELNQNMEWSLISESDHQLQPMYGPGYTGMINMGNSCYMNSVLQVLFTIPEFQARYVNKAQEIFRDWMASGQNDPMGNFNLQMAKVGMGLLSGRYSSAPHGGTGMEGKSSGIHPAMFKNLIGKGHSEFASKRQQDAQEFFLHLFTLLERNSHNQVNPAECFKFQIEERLQCCASQEVRYLTRPEYLLALNIPMDAAINKSEVAAFEQRKKELEKAGQKIDPKDTVRPQVPLSACLEGFSMPEQVEDFFSTTTGTTGKALKTTRLKTFPEYLVLQLKKFCYGENWTPVKIDVSVDVPDYLDLEFLRGQGLQPGEKELPELKGEVPKFQFDEETIARMEELGFPRDACKRALYHTKNSGIEAAINWCMEHATDADFYSPFVIPGMQQSGGGTGEFLVDEEGLQMIMSLGFTREQAHLAMKETDNNPERAADWIFSHQQELDELVAGAAAASPPLQTQDGPPRYRLVAFISHMGTSTMVGHYVCHILKEGHWVIFNDEKVALSEHPPKDLAYLYFYQRINAHE